MIMHRIHIRNPQNFFLQKCTARNVYLISVVYSFIIFMSVMVQMYVRIHQSDGIGYCPLYNYIYIYNIYTKNESITALQDNSKKLKVSHFNLGKF